MSKIKRWFLLGLLYLLYLGLWWWMAVDLWTANSIVRFLFCFGLGFIGIEGIKLQGRVWIGEGKKQGEEGYADEGLNLHIFWIYTGAWLGWFIPSADTDGMARAVTSLIGIVFFAPLAIMILSRARLFRP
ncbi:MAG: hypothetical protein Q8R07_00165 [Candidatus Uhrbacteria bacterium]|nr:hypothetical protein [Candidatus Uhrbacteria bacterium]